jgi:hypothetical protein
MISSSRRRRRRRRGMGVRWGPIQRARVRKAVRETVRTAGRRVMGIRRQGIGRQGRVCRHMYSSSSSNGRGSQSSSRRVREMGRRAPGVVVRSQAAAAAAAVMQRVCKSWRLVGHLQQQQQQHLEVARGQLGAGGMLQLGSSKGRIIIIISSSSSSSSRSGAAQVLKPAGGVGRQLGRVQRGTLPICMVQHRQLLLLTSRGSTHSRIRAGAGGPASSRGMC